jgi:hypothetical protein
LAATCIRFCEQLHFRKVLTPPWLFILSPSSLSVGSTKYIDTGVQVSCSFLVFLVSYTCL